MNKKLMLGMCIFLLLVVTLSNAENLSPSVLGKMNNFINPHNSFDSNSVTYAYSNNVSSILEVKFNESGSGTLYKVILNIEYFTSANASVSMYWLSDNDTKTYNLLPTTETTVTTFDLTNEKTWSWADFNNLEISIIHLNGSYVKVKEIWLNVSKTQESGFTLSTSSTSPFVGIHYAGFESGNQGWSFGGSDSDRSDDRSNKKDDGSSGGTWSAHLQDDSSTSNFKKSFDFTGFASVNLSFDYYQKSIDSGEYVQLFCDGTEIWRFTKGDHSQKAWWSANIEITPSDCVFDNSVQLQWQAKPGLSSNSDDMWVDGINLTGHLPDTEPPASVSNLINPFVLIDSVYWSWINPGDVDFSENLIFINGVNVLNTSSNFYNATDLNSDTNYTITIHTKDVNSNINLTDINSTVTTLQDPAPIFNSLMDSPDPLNQNEVISIIANVSDNSWVDLVWVEIGGVNYSMVPLPGYSVSGLYESENNLSLSNGYVSTTNCVCGAPSNGQCIRDEDSWSAGEFANVSFNSNLPSGVYNLTYIVCPENDGDDNWKVFVGGVEVDDYMTVGGEPSWFTRTVNDVVLSAEQNLVFSCSRGSSASYCRMDSFMLEGISKSDVWSLDYNTSGEEGLVYYTVYANDSLGNEDAVIGNYTVLVASLGNFSLTLSSDKVSPGVVLEISATNLTNNSVVELDIRNMTGSLAGYPLSLNTSGELFNYNFTVLSVTTNYTVKITDISAGVYKEVPFQVLAPYILNGSIEDALGNKISANITILENNLTLDLGDTNSSFNLSYGKKYDVVVEVGSDNPVESIMFKDVKNVGDVANLVYLDNPLENSSNANWDEVFAIDPSMLNFTNATVTVTAVGTHLFKCVDWNFTAQNCINDSWSLLKNLVPGEKYNFTITSTDPGFLETSEAVDLALAPIDNESFVVAFIDNVVSNLSFKIMNTNGSVILNTVNVDGVTSLSRVSVSMINKTHFVIGYINGLTAQADARMAIYDVNGNQVLAPTVVDADVEQTTNSYYRSDVSVAQMGDRYAFCYVDDAQNDASYYMFSNDGTQINGEVDADPTFGPNQYLNNLIGCTGVNGSRWVYFYFDDGADDATFRIINEVGTSVVGPVDIDTNIGVNGQVAVTTLDDNKFAMVYYDLVDQDITIAIRDVNNNVILAPTDIDLTVGTTSRISVGALKTTGSDLFVPVWFNQAAGTIKAAVYNGSGVEITAPFIVSSSPDPTYLLTDVIGRDAITGNSLCLGTFTVGFTNSSNLGEFKTFLYNGSVWDGDCVIPPMVKDLRPFVNSSFNVSDVIEIAANISATHGVGTVIANITLPNGSVDQITLVNAVASKFNASFVVPAQVGNYSVKFFANDTFNNVNVTETTFFVGNDVVPPSVFDLRPVNGSNFNTSDVIEFSVNVTDDVAVSVVFVNITLPNSSITILSLTNVVGDKFNASFNLSVDGDYTIRFFANDTSKNINKSVVSVVNAAAIDVVPPSVFDLRPVNGSNFNTSDVIEFSVNVTDVTAVDTVFVNVSLPNGSVQKVGLFNSVGDLFNNTFVVPVQVGTYTVRFVANDTSNNVNDTETTFFSVTNDAPVVINVSLNATSKNNVSKDNLTVLFDVFDTEGDSIKNVTNWYVGEVSITGLNLPFEGGSNSTFTKDYSGSSNNGIVKNGASFNVSGGFDGFGAYKFDGINDFIDVSDDISLRPDNLTIEAWVKQNSFGSYETILIKTTDGNLWDDGYGLAYDGGDNGNGDLLTFWINGYTTAFAQTSLVLGEWTYIVGTYDGAVIKLYKNGLEVNSTAYNVSIIHSTADVLIGQGNSGNLVPNYLFDGIIDEIRIYNRALSAEQVWMLYQNKTNLIISNETKNSETWKSCVTSNDGIQDSIEICSNNLTIMDVVPPSVFDLRPVVNASFNVSDVIEIGVNVTDDIAVDTVFVNVSLPNGSVQKVGLFNSVGDLFNNTFVVPVQVGTYTVRFVANDTSNNINSSVTTFFVGNDVLVPVFSGISESPLDPAIYSVGAAYKFNVTWVDDVAVDGVVIEHNFSGVLVNSTMNNLSSEYFSDFIGLPAGSYRWRSFANDTSGNMNQTTLQTYTITKASDNVSLFLNGVQGNLTIPFGTQSNVSAVSISGTEQLFKNGTLITNPEIATLGVGSYLFKANSTGNQNYSVGVGVSYLLAVNRAASFVNLTLDGIDGNVTVEVGSVVNLTGFVVDGEGVVRLLNEGSQLNQGKPVVSNLSQFSSIGVFNITVVYDQTQNFSSSFETHYVDVVDTILPSVFDLRPVVNASFNVSDVVVISANVTDVTAVDTVFVNVSLPNGSVQKVGLFNSVGDLFNNTFVVPVQVGTYTVRFVANDTSNNINSTVTTFFVGADVVPPSVFDLRPVVNASFNVSDVIEIGVNVTDDIAVDTVFVNVSLPNGSVQKVGLFNSVGDLFNNTFVVPVQVGTYTVRFVANDTSNNINSSVTTFFVGNDFQSPTIFDVSPSTGTNVTVLKILEISVNVTDNVAVSRVLANVTMPNGSTNLFSLANLIGDKYNVSFSPDVLGQYNVTFFANDTSNNVNLTVTTLFVSVDDVPPIVAFVSPTPSNGTYNVSQNISVNASDNFALDSIEIIVNGSVVNTCLASPCNYVLSTSGNFTFLGRSNDTNGNINTTSDRLVEIMLFDETAPSAVTGLAESDVGTTFILWNWTNPSDPDFSQAIILLDGVNIVNTSASFFNVTGLQPNTVYNLTIKTKDLAGNINVTNVSDLATTLVDIFVPLTFDPKPVSGSIFNASSLIELSINVTDDVLVDVVLANVTLPNGTVKQFILTNLTSNKFNASFTVPALLGNYTVLFIANDSENNVNSTVSTFFVGVDEKLPGVFYVSPTPVNGTYNTSQIIKVNASDNVAIDSIQIIINNITKTTCISSPCSFLVNFNGNLTFFVQVNDTSNNTNLTSTRSIEMVIPDVDAPGIISNLAETVLGTDFIFWNWTNPSDLDFDQVILYLNGVNVANTSNNFFNFTDLVPNMTYVLTVNTKDFIGNVNFTNVTDSANTLVDSEAPLVSNPIPSSGVNFSVSDVIELSVNVTDNTKVDVVMATVTFPNSSVQILVLTNLSQKYNVSFTIPSLVGQYSVVFFANDTVNNINNSVTTFFVGNDVIAPFVFDLKPLSGSFFNITDVVEISVNITDDVLVDTVFANITLPNGSVTQKTLSLVSGDRYNFSFMVPQLGNYTIQFLANDSSNNLNSTEITFFVGLDQVSPKIFDLKPLSGSVFNISEEITIAFNVTDNLQIGTVLANVSLPNGSVVDLNLSVGLRYSASFVIPALIGNYTIKFFANDTSNNVNNSEMIFFVGVDPIPPVIVSASASPVLVINDSNITLNVVASDATLDSITASITKPLGGIDLISLTSGINSSYQTTEVGLYSVVFFVNDSAGNGVTLNDSFTAEVPTDFIHLVIDADGNNVSTNLTGIFNDEEFLLAEFLGLFNGSLPNTTIDLRFNAFNGLQVLFRNVTLSLDNNKTTNLDRLPTPLSGFLVTYAVESQLNVSISEPATLTVSYADLSVSDEDNLEFLVCNDYNFTSRVCDSNFVDANATQDKVNDLFVVNRTSFSAFAIKQIVVSAPSVGGGGGRRCDDVCQSGEIVCTTKSTYQSCQKINGCFQFVDQTVEDLECIGDKLVCVEDWGCADWLYCMDGRQTRFCVDKNSCGTIKDRPDLMQSCEVKLPERVVKATVVGVLSEAGVVARVSSSIPVVVDNLAFVLVLLYAIILVAALLRFHFLVTGSPYEHVYHINEISPRTLRDMEMLSSQGWKVERMVKIELLKKHKHRKH